MCSCNTDNLGEDIPSVELHQKSIEVTLSNSESPISRVAMADDGQGGYTVSWSLGDAVGGWCEGVYNNSSFNEFEMNESSYSVNSATFKGSIQYAEDTDNVRFVYPYNSATKLYNKENTIDGYTNYMNAFDISLAKQSVKADLSHLAATTYMVSDGIAYAEIESVEPRMRHVGAVMDLNLKLASSEGYSLVKVAVNGMPTDATLNLLKSVDDADFMELSALSSSYEVAVDSFVAQDDIYSLTLNILPFTLAADSSISVEATFVDASLKEYTASATFTSTGSEEFTRSTRNTLNLILEDFEGNEGNEGNEGDGELSEVEYIFDYEALGTSWKNNTEMTIGDMSWYIDGMKDGSNGYGNISFSYYNGEGGSCYNITPFGEGITEVVVDFKDGTDFALYAGEAQNPTSNEIAPVVSGTTYTYTLAESMQYIKFKNNSEGYINVNSIKIKYMSYDGAGGGGNSGGDDDQESGGTTPMPDNDTAYSGWAELPAEISDPGNYYYAYHTVSNGSATVRNFGACYSNDYTCPVWVAGPMHSSYTGSVSRTDAYADDPQIDCYQVETLGSPYNRGHMIASSDRTASTAMNKQAFYLSNIAPQLLSYFNSGGGVWNNYEDYIKDQYKSRADTLYIVNGCHWENTSTVVKGTTVPTHYYKAVLRTKQAGSSKWVGDCSADELECVAFYFEHKSSQDDPQSSHMISISDLEKKTGWSYFENAPNAPKDTFNPSDWDL